MDNPKYEVVVSGLSGVFPEADDVDELCHNLFNKIDMVTTDSRRWPPGDLGVPSGTGKLKSRDVFDNQFFGTGVKLAEAMDPISRICLEQSFRAVCDSGISMHELNGTNTAVYVASSIIETEGLIFTDTKEQGQYAMQGVSRAMHSNKISFFFNLKGPSLSFGSCWNGGMEALEAGYNSVASGESVAAVIGCCSVMFTPHISFHFDAMGRLSKDSATRCFSSDSDGYARSEGSVFLFIQRAEHAKRSYGTILGVNSLQYGSRTLQFPEFSEEKYKEFLQETYRRAKVDPSEVAYYEAIGTASKEVDARELNAAAEVFLPKRKDPLLIGSVKSNMGHTEAAASLVSVAKAIIAMEKGIIPPNLHYKSPNPNIPALVSGKFKVVTECTPLEGDVVGVSSLGLAGPIAHVILKRNLKAKDAELEVGKLPADKIPRLILLSGRVPANLTASIKKLHESSVDKHFVDLMNNLLRDGVRNHLVRGYSVLDGTANKYHQIEAYSSGSGRRPVWFVFSGMGSQWPGMGKALMSLPVFANAIQKCHNALAVKKMDLISAITSEDPKVFDNILNAFVGIAAVQIGLADVLKAAGVQPDGIVGHSLGEQGCAYADGCFTTEEMILSAYARGKASLDASLIKGMMAAVGMGYQDLKNSLPENVEIACHNSKDSCTLSGPAEDVQKFVTRLKGQGVFAKLVNVGDIAFHSKYIKPAGELLLQYLREVVVEPKRRTSRWISSSVPKHQWDTKLGQYCSAEYHANNMLSPVLFEEATSFIPEDAIVIEMAPHGLLQSILKRSMPNALHISLTNRFDGDNLMYLLGALGKLYAAGVPINTAPLYPKVEYPVPRGTSFLSPFIGWSNTEEFSYLTVRDDSDSLTCWKILNVDLSEDLFRDLVNHKVGNKFIIPNSFYVDQLMQIFTEHKGASSGVVIQNLEFDNYCEITDQNSVAISFKVLQGTGEFCISKETSDVLLSKGNIQVLDTKSLDWKPPVIEFSLQNMCREMKGSDFLAHLRYEGLELSEGFASIKRVIMNSNKIKAIINWNADMTEFLNSAFTVVGYCEGRESQRLVQVKSVRELIIETEAFESQSNVDVTIEYSKDTKILQCNGMKIILHEVAPFKMDAFQEEIAFSCELPQFIPYSNPKVQTVSQILELSVQIILENGANEGSGAIKVIAIGDSLKEGLSGVLTSPKYAGSFEMKSYTSETEFLEQESLDYVYSAGLVVSSATAGSHYAATSLAKTFILLTDFTDSAEWVTISTFKLNGVTYTLAQSARQVHYEIVPLGVEMSVVEKKLGDANEKNVEDNREDHVIFLSGNITSVSMGMEIIEATSALEYGHLLRYMFTENTALDVASYRDQIKKGVRVNVNMSGTWGSFRALPIELSEQVVTEDVYTKVPVHQIASIVQSSDVVALGVNLGDPTGSLEDDFIRLFDYATPNVIGVANYDPISNNFVKDEILQWNRPSCWSETQAASVPVLYSLASYIVHVLHNQVVGNSILINRGMIPLSQALISLSLDAGLDIIVTVYGPEEKKLILEKFPQLKSEQIFDCNSSSLHVPILNFTNGEGVYKVVNTFPGDIMIPPCVKCTSERGIYIQVSAAPMLSNSTMGMICFNDEIIACGATVDIVMSLPAEQKKLIKDSVKRALTNGRVVPCDNIFLLPSNISNIDAAKQMSFVQNKAVVDLSRTSKEHTEVFIGESDGNYVIVGEEPQTYFWVKLTEWLMRRGARKVEVVLKFPTLPPEVTLRLQSIKEKYPTSNIIIHPATRFASKSAIKQFVNGSELNLKTIFLIGSAVKDVSAVLNEVLQEQGVQCEMICLGRGVERLSERVKNGLRSISIRCTPAVLEMSSFLQRLDGLIAKGRIHSLVTANRYSMQRFLSKPANEWTRIPTTLPELCELSKKTSPKPIFVEMASMSSRLSDSKECDPVFIFPGLRPGRTSRVTSSMIYPVLVAQLPVGYTDIESMAAELALQLAARRQTLFTLIGVEWGGTLALHTASKLQSLGRLATVILLDGAPATTRSWAAKIMTDDFALLSKFTKLPVEVLSRVKETPAWENKMKILRECADLENPHMIEGISMLRNRLQEVLTAKPSTQKLRMVSHLFLYGLKNKNDDCGLNEYLEKKAAIHRKEAADVSEMIDKSIEDVNSLVLFEHKDAARLVKEGKLGCEFIVANVPLVVTKARVIA